MVKMGDVDDGGGEASTEQEAKDDTVVTSNLVVTD